MRKWIRITNLSPVREFLLARACRAFVRDREQEGVSLRDRDTPLVLSEIRTLLIDTPQVMEGWDAVRMAAAPLTACDMNKFRRQGSWMLLTAGVSLSCQGSVPLETFARELNFEYERMTSQFPKVEGYATDGDAPIEVTVHRDAGGLRAFAKGDPETLLSLCHQVLDGKERPLTEEDRQEAEAAARDMRSHGLRTIAFATKWLDAPGAYDRDMVFLGTIGMGDLVQQEAATAFEALRRAGVRPCLYAEEALPEAAVRAGGVLRKGGSILYGEQMETLSGAALREAAHGADAFLAFSAAHRGKLLRSLRAEGPVAVLVTAEDGSVRIATGRGDGADATIPAGGLEAATHLILDCIALREAYAAKA